MKTKKNFEKKNQLLYCNETLNCAFIYATYIYGSVLYQTFNRRDEGVLSQKNQKFLQYVFFHSTTKNVLIDFVGLEFGFKLFVFLLRFDGCKKKIFLLQNLGKNALCCCCEKMATGCCLLSAPNTLPLTHSAADGRDTVGWALLLLFV